MRKINKNFNHSSSFVCDPLIGNFENCWRILTESFWRILRPTTPTRAPSAPAITLDIHIEQFAKIVINFIDSHCLPHFIHSPLLSTNENNLNSKERIWHNRGQRECHSVIKSMHEISTNSHQPPIERPNARAINQADLNFACGSSREENNRKIKTKFPCWPFNEFSYQQLSCRFK